MTVPPVVGSTYNRASSPVPWHHPQNDVAEGNFAARGSCRHSAPAGASAAPRATWGQGRAASPTRLRSGPAAPLPSLQPRGSSGPCAPPPSCREGAPCLPWAAALWGRDRAAGRRWCLCSRWPPGELARCVKQERRVSHVSSLALVWFAFLQGTPSGRGVVPHPPPREGNEPLSNEKDGACVAESVA